VGIATGRVVVGDLIRNGPAQEQSAVGKPPHQAARLQTLAEPGQVVVDALTHRLAAAFTMQPLPARPTEAELPGAYRVTGERPSDSRFDACKGRELAPMVGRDQELSILAERWSQAQDGEGQGVLLVGEAGIGKSRLARAMIDACGPGALRLRWQCSPYHTGSALWPVSQQIMRAARLQPGDSGDEALDKLEAVVGDRDASATYAPLLGLDGSRRYGPLPTSPQALRERTLDVLVEQLFLRAGQQSLLLVVEDAHWIDPTTLELIERCLERIERAPMLLLVTSRPDGQPRLAAHPCMLQLSLNRLPRSNVQQIVARLAGDRLQPHTLERIAAQADGVPLFVEELTQAVLETGETEIPASLHSSLMARLDRLPQVKALVQTAACIGRDFDAALLKAAVQQPQAVDEGLRCLVDAGLIFRRSRYAGEAYTFKHALVQAVAYDSMLRDRRKAVHATLLGLLQTARVETLPDILAYHAQGADLTDQAVGHWRDAGDAALNKSAYWEAAACYARAIELLARLPAGAARDAQEMQLQLQLGHASRASQGIGASVPQQAYKRAQQLLQSVPHDVAARFRALYGLWAGQVNRGEIQPSLELATQALQAEQADGTPDSLFGAHRMYATSNKFLGHFAVARRHFEKAMGLVDSPRRAEFTSQSGLDPAVTLLCNLGITQSIQGDIAMGRHRQRQALELSAGIPQVHARAYMHFLRALHAVCIRDAAAAAVDTDAVEDLVSRGGMELFPARVSWLRAWLSLETGAGVHDAVRQCERAVGDLEAKGSRLFVPLFRGGLAQALAREGQGSAARVAIETALQECRSSAQGWYEAELLRLRGELLRDGGAQHAQEAEQSFRQAIALAHGQGARLWELRAVAGLARLWAARGRRAAGLQMVSRAAGQLGGADDAADIADARRLLAELA
jgi:tetratricopeptide (TPR) repeat protein